MVCPPPTTTDFFGARLGNQAVKNCVNCKDDSKLVHHSEAGNGMRDGLKTDRYESICSQASRIASATPEEGSTTIP